MDTTTRPPVVTIGEELRRRIEHDARTIFYARCGQLAPDIVCDTVFNIPDNTGRGGQCATLYCGTQVRTLSLSDMVSVTQSTNPVEEPRWYAVRNPRLQETITAIVRNMVHSMAPHRVPNDAITDVHEYALRNFYAGVDLVRPARFAQEVRVAPLTLQTAGTLAGEPGYTADEGGAVGWTIHPERIRTIRRLLSVVYNAPFNSNLRHRLEAHMQYSGSSPEDVVLTMFHIDIGTVGRLRRLQGPSRTFLLNELFGVEVSLGGAVDWVPQLDARSKILSAATDLWNQYEQLHLEDIARTPTPEAPVRDWRQEYLIGRDVRNGLTTGPVTFDELDQEHIDRIRPVLRYTGNDPETRALLERIPTEPPTLRHPFDEPVRRPQEQPENAKRIQFTCSCGWYIIRYDGQEEPDYCMTCGSTALAVSLPSDSQWDARDSAFGRPIPIPEPVQEEYPETEGDWTDLLPHDHHEEENRD